MPRWPGIGLREARLTNKVRASSDSYSTIVTDDTTTLLAGGAQASLKVLGQGGIVTSGVNGDPDTLYIGLTGDGSGFDHKLLTNIGELTHDNLDTISASAYGSIVETIDIDVDASGADIQFTLQGSGGTDLTVVTPSGLITLDCTPACAVSLTAGTATTPAHNYVYLDNGQILTSSTDWPNGSFHSPIAKVLVLTKALTASNGALKVHAFTDHLSNGDSGHITHIGKRIRIQNAIWETGVATTTTPAISGSGAQVDIATSAGSVFQMHPHTFPAFDGEVDGMNIVNDNTTPYQEVTNLADILVDAEGNSLTNKHYTVVVWGVVSEKTGDCHLMINMPTGSYNTEAAATADASKYTVFSIPQAFTGTGFLISTVQLKNTNDTSWTVNAVLDQRGKTPAGAGGGGAGITDHGDLAGLTDVADHPGYATLDGTRNFTGDITIDTMTAGSIPYIGAAGLLTENNAELFWNNATKEMRLGTNSAAVVDSSYYAKNAGRILCEESGSTSVAAVSVLNNASDSTSIFSYGSGNPVVWDTVALAEHSIFFGDGSSGSILNSRNGTLCLMVGDTRAQCLGTDLKTTFFGDAVTSVTNSHDIGAISKTWRSGYFGDAVTAGLWFGEDQDHHLWNNSTGSNQLIATLGGTFQVRRAGTSVDEPTDMHMVVSKTDASSSNSFLGVQSGTEGNAGVMFGDSSSGNDARIDFDNNDLSLSVISSGVITHTSAGTSQTYVTQSGVSVGPSAAASQVVFHVQEDQGSFDVPSECNMLFTNTSLSTDKARFSIQSGTAAIAGVNLGDSAEGRESWIEYDNNDSSLLLGASNGGSITLKNNRIGAGTNNPLAKLHVDQSATTGNAVPVLTLDQADISEEFIHFIGESHGSSAAQCLVDAADLTTPGTLTGWIKIEVTDVFGGGGPIANGTYFIPFYTAPTA